MNSRNKSKRGRKSKSLILKDIEPKKSRAQGQTTKRWGRSEVCEDSSYSEGGKVTAWRKRQRQIALIIGSQWTERERVMTRGQLETQD